MFCSGLSMYEISQIVLSCVTQGNVWSIGSQFLFFQPQKKVRIIFDLGVFWDVPRLKIAGLFETLSCWKSFHITRHHVGLLCWLRFDPVFYSWVAFCGKRKNRRNNIHDMLQIPQIPWDDPRREGALDQCLNEDSTFHHCVRPPQFIIIFYFFSPNAFVKTATLQTNKLLILEMFLCSDSQHWLFTQTTNKTCS